MSAILIALSASQEAVAVEENPGFGLGASLGLAGFGLLPAPTVVIDAGYRFSNGWGADVFLDAAGARYNSDTWMWSTLATTVAFRGRPEVYSPVLGVGPAVGIFSQRGSDFVAMGVNAGLLGFVAFRVPLSQSLRLDATGRVLGSVYPGFLVQPSITLGMSWVIDT